MVTVSPLLTFLSVLLLTWGVLVVEMEITLESLLVLDKVLLLEWRLLELRLAALLFGFKGP